MYEVGDYVVHGSNGVCRVDEIGLVNIDGISRNRKYYFMTPINSKGCRLYTPVDNEEKNLRPVISKEEVYGLIRDIGTIEVISVRDEKHREIAYREIMNKFDCENLMKIIKTIHLRKTIRINEGKKLLVSDQKYLKLAEEYLFGEIAVSLGIKKEEAEELIYKNLF